MPRRLLPEPLLKTPPLRVTHFTLCYPHITSPHPYSVNSAAAAKSNAVLSTAMGIIVHSAAASKFNAVLDTQLRLILHLCALAAWQYTLNATQPSRIEQAVSSLQYLPRAPPHRFLKRTAKYLLNHKMTHCSTYTTPDLPKH